MDGPIARYHSLDALRAAMMLLGLVLHSAASYTATPLGEGWPYQDLQTSRHFELPLFLIHLFRMPAFFAAAGFFAALLYERDGPAGFARNRAKRVLLPLVIFWALVGPLVLGGFYFAMTHSGRITGPELLAAAGARTGPADISPLHLWFLWYLVLFYAATLAVFRIAGDRRMRADTAARLTTSWWSLPLWGGVTSLTLLPMRYPGIDASPLLLPDPRPVIAYGVFFVFGWLLYRGRARLERLTMWWSWRLPVAVLAIVAPSYVVIRQFAGDARIVHAAGCVFIGFSTWALVLASFGGFIHYMRVEHARVRYISDASYWMYIVHLPIVIWTAGLLARAPLHAGFKFVIVLAVTTAVCLATYHAFVRRTAIGELLNGRRYGSSRAPALGTM